MKMRFQFIYLCLFFLCVYVSPAISFAKDTANKKVFDAKTTTLDNGLQVVVVENHRAPVITQMVWYRVGAADEPRGKSGIAHFLEHLMFKGNSDPQLGTIDSGMFSKTIRALGGNDNAFTSQDYTAYFQSISKDHLETVMKMEASRMRGLMPPAEEVVSENKVIQEERRQRTDNDPRAQMNEQFNEALFPNHPYSIPIIGWMHEIQNLTWKDAKDFYDLYYAPNNAILIISGDVNADDVFEIAKRTYGLLKTADTPKRERTQSPPFVASTSVVLEHENIKEPLFKREYRTPSFRQDKAESLALQVLEEIMSGGATSRLYKSLVVEQKLATNVSLSYDSAAWDDATLSINATPAQGKTIEDVKAAIDTELNTLIKNGVSTQELEDAITRMQDAAIYARDSLTGPAMIIGYNLVTGSSLDDIEHWPQQIKTITAEQIQNVAKKYLNPDAPYQYPPVEGVLLPKVSEVQE